MKNQNWKVWIAFRYWRSKKSFSIINIISGISFWGIAIGTAALIIVLSAFNGLEAMVGNMFNRFHSDYRIEPVSGKFFHHNQLNAETLNQMEGVENWSYVVEDICMVRYQDRQQIAMIKGVEPNRGYEEHFDPLILNGTSDLQEDSVMFAILGAGLYYRLGVNLHDYSSLLTLYSPDRRSKASADISTSFLSESVMAGGVFSVQQEFDERYILVPDTLARSLLAYHGISTAIEITAERIDASLEQTLQQWAGDQFVVKNRMEQEEALYKIMRSEKLIVFLILALILLIISFTMISSLTLMIISKKRDLSTLFALGAGPAQIRQILTANAFVIALAASVTGMIISVSVVLLQQRFGLVRFETGSILSTNYYPVKLLWIDFASVMATVIVITYFVSRIPVRRISSRYLTMK